MIRHIFEDPKVIFTTVNPTFLVKTRKMRKGVSIHMCNMTICYRVWVFLSEVFIYSPDLCFDVTVFSLTVKILRRLKILCNVGLTVVIFQKIRKMSYKPWHFIRQHGWYDNFRPVPWDAVWTVFHCIRPFSSKVLKTILTPIIAFRGIPELRFFRFFYENRILLTLYSVYYYFILYFTSLVYPIVYHSKMIGIV